MASTSPTNVAMGGNVWDLTELRSKEQTATEDLKRATEERTAIRGEIQRLNVELSQEDTTKERREQLEQRIDKEKELLAAAQASVNKAQDRCVSLCCRPLAWSWNLASPHLARISRPLLLTRFRLLLGLAFDSLMAIENDIRAARQGGGGAAGAGAGAGAGACRQDRLFRGSLTLWFASIRTRGARGGGSALRSTGSFACALLSFFFRGCSSCCCWRANRCDRLASCFLYG